MLRKGIPPPLRCAVWLSNVIQSSHPHQELKYAHEYRTLAKVRVLDFAYDALWVGDNAPLAGSQLDTKVDMKRFSTFGNTKLLSDVPSYPPKGQLALQRVLHALDYILGVEHAPMIPTLATVFLSTMSQSYAFTAIREMAHHSNWYWPCSRSEHVAHGRTFLDVLCKLHPSTAATIEHLDIGTKLTDAIFQDLFIPLIPEENVFRIVDIYTLEGTKVLYRFGVALVVLYQKVWKNDGTPPVQEGPGGSVGDSSMESCSGPPALTESESNTSIPDDRTGEDWWEGLVAWTHSTDFNWELLVRKAYGVHGRGVRKRYRFPRRPILARILKLEEDRYIQEQQMMGKMANADSAMPTVFPMGLIVSSNATIQPGDDREPIVPKLAEQAWVRTKLAEWLPLSLRLTKMDLIYSTNSHGRTLESFYRHCQYAKHTLVLIEPLASSSGSSSASPAIQAVGMYASQTWISSSRVYGDGECFLFRLVKDDTDASQCWKWKPKQASHDDEVLEVDSGDEESGAAVPAIPSASTKNNQTALLEQFQVGTDSYISMGGNQDGSSGLRLNEDLTTAESAKASGFDNEPLAGGGMFEVGVVEVYQLVRSMNGS